MLALVLSAVPVIHYPFGWFETLFHELSHGLAALLTGGKLLAIELGFDGSGYCFTSGGNQVLILISGYAGSSLWGVLVFISGSSTKAYNSTIAMLVPASVIALVTVLWARDVVTLVILITMFILLVMAYRFVGLGVIRYIVQFSGVYVVLNSIRSSLSLVDGKSVGDGSALAEITHIPELIWVVVWCFVAVICLLYLYRRAHSGGTLVSLP
ncbi:MAG: M50 family metallopeptidase [Candidatus Thiodiazotropha sp. (ex Monitilora ramsayi)]|nr:M50 family metallopeptidase [Candidatus Thiodiazotropha sp. (ex Monitilora ramsayi)]